MELFAQLYEKLDQTHSTNEKISLMSDYFRTIPSKDAVWGLFFLSGNRLKRFISSNDLRIWCLELLSMPEWLFEESYAAVGDTAETVTLLLPKQEKKAASLSLSQWMEERIIPLEKATWDEKKNEVFQWWEELSDEKQEATRFVLNKILTGSFRVGVSHLLTLRALEEAFGVERAFLAEKLFGSWEPSSSFFETLKSKEIITQKTIFQPYPFFLASTLVDLKTLGEPHEWLAEWKWDGIRAQIIFRGNQVALWSRGMEFVNDQFPEVVSRVFSLPVSCVLDGEIVGYKEGRPLSFGALQKRLNRKKISRSLLEEVPVNFISFDLLELESEDLRTFPLRQRREKLKMLIHASPFLLSTEIEFKNWSYLQEKKEEARMRGAEGLVLKKWNSPYEVGRKRGSWWKYKINPMTLDVVLLYAQSGSGIRANLYTDYTFGIWQEETLVPIAKAYSGLNQEEIGELDRWIRQNTEEKFGPVRKVKPVQVFELAFEGIQPSNRHKSKIAVRFPRIVRWRKDKLASEANTVEDAKKLIL